jgi:hypothetical protein
MTVYTSETRRVFYDQVLQLALRLQGRDRWCRAVPANVPGGMALVPDNYVTPEWIAEWPVLPDGEPGWVPSNERIQAAFTAILRATGRTAVVSTEGRHAIHMAEQYYDYDRLGAPAADLVLQIAVFGRVIFD